MIFLSIHTFQIQFAVVDLRLSVMQDNEDSAMELQTTSVRSLLSMMLFSFYVLSALGSLGSIYRQLSFLLSLSLFSVYLDSVSPKST